MFHDLDSGFSKNISHKVCHKIGSLLLDTGSVKLYAGLAAGVGKRQSILEKKCNMLLNRLLQEAVFVLPCLRDPG